MPMLTDPQSIESMAFEGMTPAHSELEEWRTTAEHDAAVHKGLIKTELDRLGRPRPAKPHYRYYYNSQCDQLNRYPNAGYIDFQRKDPLTGDFVDRQEFKGSHIRQVGGDALLSLVAKQQAANAAGDAERAAAAPLTPEETAAKLKGIEAAMAKEAAAPPPAKPTTEDQEIADVRGKKGK